MVSRRAFQLQSRPFSAGGAAIGAKSNHGEELEMCSGSNKLASRDKLKPGVERPFRLSRMHRFRAKAAVNPVTAAESLIGGAGQQEGFCNFDALGTQRVPVQRNREGRVLGTLLLMQSVPSASGGLHTLTFIFPSYKILNLKHLFSLISGTQLELF
jgi:hypothetical protein